MERLNKEDSVIATKEDREQETLIYNRKINFIDSWDDFGLSDTKRIEFMRYYWLNVSTMTVIEALEEFKNN